MDRASNKTFSRVRSTREVVEDHLRKRVDNRLEDDLAENYAEDVVLLTCTGIFHGHAGVRESNRVLEDSLPNARVECFNLLFEGEFAFVEWRGFSNSVEVNEGADSFVVRNGKIAKQSIHYKVQQKSEAISTSGVCQ